jgi:hypothetical protein
MNPFVNPKKRGVSLPTGCKDLIDLLKRHNEALASPALGNVVRQFIHMILFQAHQDQATELVIGVPSPSGDTPIRYKVGDSWYDMYPFPSQIRHDVVAELASMAHLPDGKFPKQGVLSILSVGIRLRWVVSLASPDGLCTLVRAQE